MNNIKYDIILVYAFFRRHNYYLNIIKYLSNKYTIGIYVTNTKKAERTRQTDKLFLKKCQEFGGVILNSHCHSCKLMLIPQYDFESEIMGKLFGEMKSDKQILLGALGTGLLTLEVYAKFGVNTIFVPDLAIFNKHLEDSVHRESIKSSYNVFEMGAPYLEYPVFPEIVTDYVIAIPTLMSLRPGLDRRILLYENIIRLIRKINTSNENNIFIKGHNAKDSTFSYISNLSIVNKFILSFKTIIRYLLLITHDLQTTPVISIFILKVKGVYLKILHLNILRISTPFSTLTKYHNFGLELFLPNTKKGIITGLSSITWFAFLMKIPIYNCSDSNILETSKKDMIIYNRIGIKTCNGELKFNVNNFDKINDITRKADLIKLIEKEINI